MTAKTTATRAEAIAAAVDKFAGAELLPDWAGGGAESDYMHGMCAVIADTFGTSDPENARSEVWEEMRVAFEQEKRRATAEKVARQHLDGVLGNAPSERLDALESDDYRQLSAAFTAAVLAGMEAA